MKKKLLKPPENNEEILALPSLEHIAAQLEQHTTVGTAHQPYFFNPGVSLKFLLLEHLPAAKRKIIFVDTDRLSLEVKMPVQKEAKVVSLINDQQALFNYPPLSEGKWKDFFSSLEKELNDISIDDFSEVGSNISLFKEIIFKQLKKNRFLKDVLAKSFLEFYGIDSGYKFLSQLIIENPYKNFVRSIYSNDTFFRGVFNQALDDYREEFRFRFENYPFPRLEENEVPFWIVKEGKRKRCFKKDITVAAFNNGAIFPRASTLTIFLRLYEFDFFIHGVGGANYDWVSDRVIERFFDKKPPAYGVMSGTFLIGDSKERELPYFFFNPQKIRNKINASTSLNNFKPKEKPDV